jgi:hypothetical protein
MAWDQNLLAAVLVLLYKGSLKGLFEFAESKNVQSKSSRCLEISCIIVVWLLEPQTKSACFFPFWYVTMSQINSYLANLILC